jgi:hypothetical protein
VTVTATARSGLLPMEKVPAPCWEQSGGGRAVLARLDPVDVQISLARSRSDSRSHSKATIVGDAHSEEVLASRSDFSDARRDEPRDVYRRCSVEPPSLGHTFVRLSPQVRRSAGVTCIAATGVHSGIALTL